MRPRSVASSARRFDTLIESNLGSDGGNYGAWLPAMEAQEAGCFADLGRVVAGLLVFLEDRCRRACTKAGLEHVAEGVAV